MKILIAIPAYNEQETLPGVLGGLPDEIEGASSIAKLVVDDGSTDGTADAARAGGAAVIRHEKNEGVGRAFQAAVEEALRRGVDAMVTIDADGQFDASQIADLVAPAIAGEADLVTGSRFQESTRPEGMPLAKYLGNRIVAGLLRFLTGTGLSDVSCGFRAYSREALLHLNLFGRFTYTQETILDLSFKGLRIREIADREWREVCRGTRSTRRRSSCAAFGIFVRCGSSGPWDWSSSPWVWRSTAGCSTTTSTPGASPLTRWSGSRAVRSTSSGSFSRGSDCSPTCSAGFDSIRRESSTTTRGTTWKSASERPPTSFRMVKRLCRPSPGKRM
jgi:glycosyltransferase involved in cell wall biosynthesis